MECKRCGNKDKSYFYKGSKGYYCRKCIKFKRILLEEDIKPLAYEISIGGDSYHFNFDLTFIQKEASNKIKEYLKESDVLLKAVCGSGKTEMVVESIADYLNRGKKVCYSISRREVVIELEKRFKKIFPHKKVVSVYGGHHKELTGDLIVCTSHQLYRYYKTFDLLIIDEVDAFPLSGNQTLMNISLNATKGRIIFSTATSDSFLDNVLSKRNYQIVEVFIRPSNRPLTIPRVLFNLKIFHLIYLFFLLRKSKRQYIVFVSTKKLCKYICLIFKIFINANYVYSDLINRDEVIKDFRQGKYQVLFATTVLERGITIPNINVVILDFHKNIFSSANLIQMLGRVGRSMTDTNGSAYILSSYINPEIKKTLKYLKEANNHL